MSMGFVTGSSQPPGGSWLSLRFVYDGLNRIGHRDRRPRTGWACPGRRVACVEQRALDGIVAIVAIVAIVVFDGTAFKWLSAGKAIALVAIAVAGLAYNEVSEQKALRAAADTIMGESLRAAA